MRERRDESWACQSVCRYGDGDGRCCRDQAGRQAGLKVCVCGKKCLSLTATTNATKKLPYLRLQLSQAELHQRKKTNSVGVAAVRQTNKRGASRVFFLPSFSPSLQAAAVSELPWYSLAFVKKMCAPECIVSYVCVCQGLRPTLGIKQQVQSWCVVFSLAVSEFNIVRAYVCMYVCVCVCMYVGTVV